LGYEPNEDRTIMRAFAQCFTWNTPTASRHTASRPCQRPYTADVTWRQTLAIACFVACLAWAAVTAPPRLLGALLWNRAHVTDDFGLFYSTAQCFVSGCTAYLTTGAPNLNPPQTHLLILPFLGLAREPAFLRFLLLNALVVSFMAWLVLRRVLGWPVGVVIVSVGLSGLSSLTHLEVATGQIYPLLGALLAVAWILARSGHWTVAVCLVAALSVLKPPLALLLAWLLWQRPATWRPALLAVLSTIGVGLLLGPAAYLGWLHALTRASTYGSGLDGSLLQTLVRVFEPHASDTSMLGHLIPPLWSAPLARPLWMLGAVALLIDLTRWTRTASLDRAWLGVLAAMLLISPKGWVYMGWLLLWPALAVWWKTGSSALTVAGALLLIPERVPRLAGTPWSSVIVGSLFTWTWLLVYLGARRAEDRSRFVSGAADGPTRDPILRSTC
jgi:hypothetical protein